MLTKWQQQRPGCYAKHGDGIEGRGTRPFKPSGRSGLAAPIAQGAGVLRGSVAAIPEGRLGAARALNNRKRRAMLSCWPKWCKVHHMNTPRKHPVIRLTVPVPLEAYNSFQHLADAMGRSLGSVMGDWLLDTASSAQSMAEQLDQLKGASRLTVREVEALTSSVQEATQRTLDKAREGARRAPVRPAQRGAAGARLALTPPSSNTGGKVVKKRPTTQKGK